MCGREDHPPYDEDARERPEVSLAREPEPETGKPPLVHARALLTYERVSIIPVHIPPSRVTVSDDRFMVTGIKPEVEP